MADAKIQIEKKKRSNSTIFVKRGICWFFAWLIEIPFSYFRNQNGGSNMADLVKNLTNLRETWYLGISWIGY